MSCLGVHFSLSENEAQQISLMEIECDRIDYLQEVLEPEYFENNPERKAESDKAWDAMHRAFCGGELSWDADDYPLSHLILGGESLLSDSDYIMSLKTPEQVRDVAVALQGITEADFRTRYFSINPETYGMPLSEEDCSYTWEWFTEVREFWLRAAKEERYVLFTASQ